MTADSCRDVECSWGFDSFHSSHFRWSETGRLGECRPASATGRVQTQRSAAKIEQPRSIILDRPVPDLAGLEIRVDIRASRNRNVLASQAVQAVLVEVIPTETIGPPTNPFGDPETHPNHGNRQSNMGSATGTRRTEEVGVQDFRTDGVALNAQEDKEAIADLDDVFAKSRWPNGLGRFLHGPDHTTPRAVCFRHPGA